MYNETAVHLFTLHFDFCRGFSPPLFSSDLRKGLARPTSTVKIISLHTLSLIEQIIIFQLKVSDLNARCHIFWFSLQIIHRSIPVKSHFDSLSASSAVYIVVQESAHVNWMDPPRETFDSDFSFVETYSTMSSLHLQQGPRRNRVGCTNTNFFASNRNRSYQQNFAFHEFSLTVIVKSASTNNRDSGHKVVCLTVRHQRK